jgi:uncharacterized Zn ribbon protein
MEKQEMDLHRKIEQLCKENYPTIRTTLVCSECGSEWNADKSELAAAQKEIADLKARVEKLRKGDFA